jgi:hypothetical protein
MCLLAVRSLTPDPLLYGRLRKASFAQRSNGGLLEEVAGLVVSFFLALPNRLTDVVVKDV